MLARKIKDLSIALEALSRIAKIDEYVFSATESLLKDSIEQLEREHRQALKDRINQTTDDSDEIPF